MTNPKPETNETETPPLKPASENVWYALATIAGEKSGVGEKSGLTFSEWVDVQKQNCYFWNGYIRDILGEYEYIELKDDKGQQIELPQLNSAELLHIGEALIARGFSDFPNKVYEIYFAGFEFPAVDFSGFIFPYWANFDGARFTATAVFKDTVFAGKADFQAAIFTKWALFQNSNFTDLAVFQKTVFKNQTDFHNTRFTRWADFYEAEFNSVVSFNQSKFSGFIDFQRSEFQDSPPQFYDAKISENINWRDAKFPSDFSAFKKLSENKAGEHVNAYERLALMMSKLEKHHDRHMFYRLEMRARRKLEKNLLLKMINFLYEKIANYGYGVGRAASWWLGNIMAGALCLFPWKGYRLDVLSLEHWGTGIAVWFKALAVSLSHVLGFLGLSRGPLKDMIADYPKEDLIVPYGLTGTVEAILGAVFLFFLLLCARNRFRMS